MAKESKFKKETKIGIAVIGILLVVFGIVLFHRISSSDVPTAAADTETPQDAPKSETPLVLQEPTVVDNGTVQASHIDPTPRDTVEPHYTHSSRHDLDQAAHKSYMPPLRVQDDLQNDDHRGEIQAKTAAPYDTYASDRSNPSGNDTRYENPDAYPPPQGDQFRRRDAVDAQNSIARNPIVPNAADQPSRINDDRYDATQQVVVGDGEIGRDEYGSRYTPDNQAVTQDAYPAPYRQSPVVDPTTQQAPADDPYVQTPSPSQSQVVTQDTAEQETESTDVLATDPVEEPMIEQAVVPNRPANGKYIVMPNDNYSAIAKKVYGNAGYFKALAEYNRGTHPRIHSLQVGDEVLTPELTVLRDKFGSLCPKVRTPADPNQLSTLVSTTGPTKVYVVEEGDTIYDIAKFELGKASRWAEIIALNRDVLGSDIHFVRPGMKLRLPDDTAQERPANRVARDVAPNATLRQ